MPLDHNPSKNSATLRLGLDFAGGDPLAVKVNVAQRERVPLARFEVIVPFVLVVIIFVLVIVVDAW